MGNTLKDDMTADLYANVLDTSAFAETVTFYPAGGGSSRRLVASITEVDEIVPGAMVEFKTEKITVLVGNDESHARGGIEQPLHGASAEDIDALTRDDDSNARKYAFTGKAERMPGGWKLMYSRPSLVLAGVKARGRT